MKKGLRCQSQDPRGLRPARSVSQSLARASQPPDAVLMGASESGVMATGFLHPFAQLSLSRIPLTIPQSLIWHLYGKLLLTVQLLD